MNSVSNSATRPNAPNPPNALNPPNASNPPMPIQQLVSSSQKQINTISFNIDPDIASKALERRISQQREFIEKQLAEAQKDLMNNFTFTCPIPAKSGLCKGNPVRDDPGHLCAYHRKQNDDEFKKTLDPKTGKGWGRWVAPWIKPEKTAPKFEYELTAEQKEILKKKQKKLRMHVRKPE